MSLFGIPKEFLLEFQWTFTYILYSFRRKTTAYCQDRTNVRCLVWGSTYVALGLFLITFLTLQTFGKKLEKFSVIGWIFILNGLLLIYGGKKKEKTVLTILMFLPAAVSLGLLCFILFLITKSKLGHNDTAFLTLSIVSIPFNIWSIVVANNVRREVRENSEPIFSNLCMYI